MNVDVVPAGGAIDPLALIRRADLALHQAWMKRRRDTDVIVLWDAESMDFPGTDHSPTGPPVPLDRADGTRATFVPIILDERLPDRMEASGFPEVAEEMRDVRRDSRAFGDVLVPVLVRRAGGTWVTRWSPDGKVAHV